MRLLISLLIALVTLPPAVTPAGAQTERNVRIDQPLRGYVAAVHDADIVVRGRDDRTYAISTAEVDASFVTRLMIGQAVRVTLKPVKADEPLAAASVEFDTAPTRSFLVANGTVESTLDDRVQFRSVDGLGASVDLGQIVGPKPDVRPGDPVTLVYEQTPLNPVATVWIERLGSSGVYPAASPRLPRSP